MFHPFRAYRARRDAALAAERQHQMNVISAVTRVLETSLDSATTQNKQNADAMLAMAKAQATQAEAFGTWLKSFTTLAEAPTSSVVTEEDEYIEEQKQLLAHGYPADVSVMPEEFKLALALHRDVAADSMK